MEVFFKNIRWAIYTIHCIVYSGGNFCIVKFEQPSLTLELCKVHSKMRLPTIYLMLTSYLHRLNLFSTKGLELEQRKRESSCSYVETSLFIKELSELFGNL